MVAAIDLSLLIPNGSSSSFKVLLRRYSRIYSCLSVGGLSNLLSTFLRFYLFLVNLEVTGLSILIFCVELTAEKFLLRWGWSTSSEIIPKSADRQFAFLIYLLLPIMRFIDYCFFCIYLKDMLPVGTATPIPLFLLNLGWDRIWAFILTTLTGDERPPRSSNWELRSVPIVL